MTKDRLEELLREADRTSGPRPPLPNDLAARALRQVRRTRQRLMAVCQVAAMLMLAAGLSSAFWPRRASMDLRSLNANATRLAEETTQLRKEADWRQAIVKKTNAIRDHQARLAALNAVAAQPDPVRTAQCEVERAAGTLFQQGDLLYREFGLPQRAADSYREVLRVFPTSTWAGPARERLTDLKELPGDVL